MSFKDKLAKMNARYKDSEQQAKAMFGEIDPGVYMAKLANAEVVEAKSSGKLQVKRLHVVMEGDFKGANIYDYLGLENEYGFAFFREWVNKLGFEAPDDAAEIPDLLTELSDQNPIVQIKVTKSDGGFTNVRVISVEGSDAPPAESTPPETADEAPAGEEVAPESADPELFVLAQANGVEVTDDMQNADIISAMEASGKKFSWGELTAEEQEVVIRHELKHLIVIEKKKAAPAPIPQKPAAPVQKAPTSKSAPAPAPRKPLPAPAKKPAPASFKKK